MVAAVRRGIVVEKRNNDYEWANFFFFFSCNKTVKRWAREDE
jgi:hypothetical protein